MLRVLAVVLWMLLLGGCSDRGAGGESTAGEISGENILTDDATLLGDKRDLLRKYYEFNRALLDEFDIDFRIITATGDEDIDVFSNRRFTEPQRHSRSHSGKAMLLVINAVQDRVRLEVSQALEPVYTDAFVSYIERRGMVPYFRDDRVAEGIYMITELVGDRARDAGKGKEFVPPMVSRSIGAGAKTEAKIGRKDPNAQKGARVEVSNAEGPLDLLRRYLDEVLRPYNTNPDLGLYSKATREFFRKHTVTEINMDNEIRFLTPCMAGKTEKISPDGRHAVLLNEPLQDHRACSPYFFIMEDGIWRLDIATMADVLRFNRTMEWHFDMKKRLEDEGLYYAFAFDGWQFDRYGFPHPVPPEHAKPEDARWGFKCKPWYRPGEDPQKLTRCWISLVWPGSPAQVRMGMDVYDFIYAVGEGPDRMENVSYRQFMEYMASVPSGEIATIEVERTQKGAKLPHHIIRRGMAP